jgi:RNA polymerase sigma factor (sigma-70 family)
MAMAGEDLATESDTALVARARAGNRDAFRHLVERHQSLVCAIAYSETGDFALSEDIAQETLLAAWRGLGELSEPEKVRGWLAGITRNLAANARRRARPTGPLEQAGPPGAGGPTPLEDALAREEATLLWRALEEIPATYREPLVLFYREDQSVARVAEALDLSEDAVRQRLSRGRTMLREHVAGFAERTLARTRPRKAFTVAVLAALPAAAPHGAAAGVAAVGAKSSAATAGAAAASLAGAVMGPVVGLAGAYLGARTSIENTSSARERAFMKRSTWIMVAYVTAFLAGQGAFAVVSPAQWASFYVQLVLWSLYVVGLLVLIVRTNRRQHAIRIEESPMPPAPPSAMTRYAVYGSLGGGVFGSVCWLFPMCFIAGDWLLATITAVVATGLFLAGARRAAASPERYPRVAMVVFAALGGWNLLLVNLRWPAWMVAFRASPLAATSVELPLWGMNLMLVAVIVLVLIRLGGLERQ